MAATQNKNLRFVGKALEWLVFIVLILVGVFLLLPALPTHDRVASYAVVSGSMSPKIPTGSLAFTKKAVDLDVGSIIAFRSPIDSKQVVLHRIVAVDSGHGTTVYSTRGDANPTKDAWLVTPDQIKGEYIVSVPYVGYVIGWTKSPIGFIAVIGIPALILIALQVRKIRQGINEEVEKRTKKALRGQTSEPAMIESSTIDSRGKILSIGLATILGVSLLGITVRPALAYFTDQAKVSGLSIELIVDNPQPSPCPAGSLWPAEFNYPPYSTLGVTAWKDGWFNDLFDWDTFWDTLGVPAPPACTIPVAPNPFNNSIVITPTPTPSPTPTIPPFPTFPPGFPFNTPTPTPTPTVTPTPSTTPTPTLTPTPTQATGSATLH